MFSTTTALKSGVGTSMLSRTGASTITANKIFQGEFDTIDDFVAATKNQRKFDTTTSLGVNGGE